MSLNQINLIGRLVRDPEAKYVGAKSTALCRFSIAVDRWSKKADGTTEKKADFIAIEYWGKMAEILANNLRKGDPVFVSGQLRNEPYTASDGTKKYKTYVYGLSFDFMAPKVKPEELAENAKAFEKMGEVIPEEMMINF